MTCLCPGEVGVVPAVRKVDPKRGAGRAGRTGGGVLTVRSAGPGPNSLQ